MPKGTNYRTRWMSFEFARDMGYIRCGPYFDEFAAHYPQLADEEKRLVAVPFITS